MEFHSFLIKYAEIGVKGKNKYVFEDALVKQIRRGLSAAEGDFSVEKTDGRIYVKANGSYDYEETVEALRHVFGIAGICPMVQLEKGTFEELKSKVTAYMEEMYPEEGVTFKVHARRADKGYPLNSEEINRELGAAILEKCPGMKVDVHHPQVLLQVEIREKINLYSMTIPGPGGMPVGTAGKGMLLLSGGIDSPVAGYMIAKRGVQIEAVYFHAPPYTSQRAKQKVVDLAKLVSRYAGSIRLYVVNFTDIQLAIYENCPHDQLTVIMRRYMMRIAEELAGKDGCLGLITGESIGQVASQTMQSLACTNEVCALPVFRPLIGFDKEEIVTLAKKIGTYETSILPYEDCCTIFVAKHPVTKPAREMIRASEKNLEGKIEALYEKALKDVEVLWVGSRRAESERN